MLVQKYTPESTWFDPHITVHQIKCPEKNLEKVIEIAKEICAMNIPISLIPEGVNIKGSFVGIAFKKTEEIEEMHKQFVFALNTLREGAIKSSYLEHKDQSTEEEWSNIQHYGYPHVLALYTPHIAMIRLDSIDQVPSASLDVVWNESFFVTKIDLVVLMNKEKNVYTLNLGTIEKA